jgi:hypothetical protein
MLYVLLRSTENIVTSIRILSTLNLSVPTPEFRTMSIFLIIDVRRVLMYQSQIRLQFITVLGFRHFKRKPKKIADHPRYFRSYK